MITSDLESSFVTVATVVSGKLYPVGCLHFGTQSSNADALNSFKHRSRKIRAPLLQKLKEQDISLSLSLSFSLSLSRVYNIYICIYV